MEKWEEELRKKYLQEKLDAMSKSVGRGLSPMGSALLEQQRLSEEEEQRIKEIKDTILQEALLREEQGYEAPDTSKMGLMDILGAVETGKKVLPYAQKILPGLKTAGGVLSKSGVGLFTNPWALGALGLGYLFKSKFKPVKRLGKFFKRLF